MCLWSYQYFSQCSHQELDLVQPCAQSQSIDYVRWIRQEEDRRAGDRFNTSQGSRDQSRASTNRLDSPYAHPLLPSTITCTSASPVDDTILHKSFHHHHHQDTTMKAKAAHDAGFRFARDDHSDAESDGESSVRRYDIQGTRDSPVQRQAHFLQRRLNIQSVSTIQGKDRDGPNLKAETRALIRRRHKELPEQKQVTARRSQADLRGTKSSDKNVIDNGKPMSRTVGSKPSSYAMPTAASQRRSAATGSTSPASPVLHKRSVPSVRTLWQDRDVVAKQSDATKKLDNRRLFLKTEQGVPQDPAIVDFKEARPSTPDHEAVAGLSRLPRPVKRDDHVAARPRTSDRGAAVSPVMVPRTRKFSRAELLAIKTVDDQVERAEIIDKIGSSEVPDLILHQKRTTSGPETVTSDVDRTLNSNVQTASTQARPERVPDVVASLRADAPDFVPESGRKTSKVVFEPGYYNQQDPLWVPDYAWESMSYEQKREVVENRRGRGLSNVSSSDPDTFSTPTPPQLSSPIVLDPQGNVLSPKPKWTWANRRTVKTLRTLGRAPLPTLDFPSAGSSSNASEGSSPFNAWSVRPDRPGSWYGWSGGDGKEISFRGYGPHAERNPYSPHNFRNYENQATSSSAFNNQGYGYSNYGGKIQAPMGLQDWALQRGYDRVPCPNYQIGRAKENITTPENPLGWCSTCLSRRTHSCAKV